MITDTECLDWIAHQDLQQLDMYLVIDAPHDGEYAAQGDGAEVYYGKTLREAIQAAIRGEQP